ncbi:hypothetical protein XNA1_3540010 [Xenorhabdus nematophila str. Anatoliense]|nr:hypothetical protein XNA1_1130010 [Xenorhabdus nematophila str. Anatoliense]CEE93247.1 hypothetical protein XNA1_3540010 [Xenorhabdus nematophila str. Anatoliense]
MRWKQSAEELSALVRALYFGENYANPLGCPKLLLEQGTVQISWLQRLNLRSESAPGTLMSVEEEAWQVTTGSVDVLIGGFATLEGQLLSARELAETLALKSGKPLPLFSSQQSENVKNTLQVLAPREPFWCKRLAALQPVQLPFETPRKLAEPRWSIRAWQSLSLQNENDKPWQTLLQSFVIYLARLTQQTAFQIGWGVEANDKLAVLSSVVPMNIEVALNKPWHVVADSLNDELARLTKHRTFSRDLLSRSPSLHAILALKTQRPWPIAISLIQDNKRCDQKSSGELLTFQINAQGSFRWIYDENRLSAEALLRMSEHLQMLMSSKRMGNEIPIGKLNLLPESEHRLLLKTWNTTETPYPEELCIHQVIEQQAEKNPDATALVYKEQLLSYAELNRWANRLAYQLITLGIKPDQRIVICVSRSPAMIVGLLAVLKAGGAYVPLDPAYPGERLSQNLNDAAPVLVLARWVNGHWQGDRYLIRISRLCNRTVTHR